MFYVLNDKTFPIFRKKCKKLKSETGCADCHAGGILSGTGVETNRGPLDISQVRPRDYLLTAEHGMQPIVDVSASHVWTSDAICPKCFWPFLVPEHALGNTKPIIIMPEQYVSVTSDIIDMDCEKNTVLVPITTLDGYCGIKRIAPMERVLSYKIHFAQTELLVVNGGAKLNCKVEQDFLTEILQSSPATMPAKMAK